MRVSEGGTSLNETEAAGQILVVVLLLKLFFFANFVASSGLIVFLPPEHHCSVSEKRPFPQIKRSNTPFPQVMALES